MKVTNCKVCGKTASTDSNFLLTEEGTFCNNRCYQFFLNSPQRKTSLAYQFITTIMHNLVNSITIKREYNNIYSSQEIKKDLNSYLSWKESWEQQIVREQRCNKELKNCQCWEDQIKHLCVTCKKSGHCDFLNLILKQKQIEKEKGGNKPEK